VFAAWASPAAAQLARTGPTFSLGATTVPVEYPDAAFDPVNNRYLVVSGKGFIEGRLVTATGGLITSFTVNASRSQGQYAQMPRVAYSADAAPGGGFLVTWHESFGTRPNDYANVMGRIVSAAGVPLGADLTIGNAGPQRSSHWIMGAEIAYSTVSREFLVTWMGNYLSTQDIFYTRLSPGGALLQSPVMITAGTVEWERDPSVAYNPDQNEFYILFSGYSDSGNYGYTAGRRIKAGTGASLSENTVLYTGLGTKVTSVTYNSAQKEYLAAWHTSAPAFYGAAVTAATGASRGVRLLSSYYVAYDALDVKYNTRSGDYALVTHGNGSEPWEDAIVPITADGTPASTGFIATRTTDVRGLRADPARNDGNFNPRIAASTTEPKWMLVTASLFANVHGQLIQSSGTGGGGGGGGGGTPTRRVSGDFTGDGKADLAVYRASSGTWSVVGGTSATWGHPGDIPVPADYNGDGRVDFAVYRPSNGLWFVQGAPFVQWGLPGDLPVPADYDGDGKAEIAVFRPSNGHWYIRGLTTGAVHYGRPGDIPVPGDYNGDGRAEIAVFRRATGAWWIYGNQKVDWGLPGDMPVPADYDGNGTIDIAVYRPGDGNWHVRGQFTRNFGGSGLVPVPMDVDGDGRAELITMNRSTGEWRTYNRTSAALDTRRFGQPGDLPLFLPIYAMLNVTGDADGDRRADPTVVRPSTGTWYPRQSSTGGYLAIGFGLPTDVPVSADYDGDGKLDAAVFRPSTGVWYVTGSAQNFATFFASDPLGSTNDIPLAGDFDGDGRADMAIFRPSTAVWYIRSSTTDYLAVDSFTWGLPGDIPVPADYDGDGRKDPAVFRPSTGSWLVYLRASGSSLNLTWGQSGDRPVPGDFDGDGRADLVLYRGGRWLFRYSAADWTTNETNVLWGVADDVPVAADFDGDGHADVTVFRPSTGRWFIVGNGYYDFGGPGDVVAIKQ
jgi:hypothetical protein